LRRLRASSELLELSLLPLSLSLLPLPSLLDSFFRFFFFFFSLSPSLL
tara:strand:+ start:219 stop:362 length:144 start_codon:yes stop_codon:yes gene_type:complete